MHRVRRAGGLRQRRPEDAPKLGLLLREPPIEVLGQQALLPLAAYEVLLVDEVAWECAVGGQLREVDDVLLDLLADAARPTLLQVDLDQLDQNSRPERISLVGNELGQIGTRRLPPRRFQATDGVLDG